MHASFTYFRCKTETIQKAKKAMTKPQQAGDKKLRKFGTFFMSNDVVQQFGVSQTMNRGKKYNRVEWPIKLQLVNRTNELWWTEGKTAPHNPYMCSNFLCLVFVGSFHISSFYPHGKIFRIKRLKTVSALKRTLNFQYISMC